MITKKTKLPTYLPHRLTHAGRHTAVLAVALLLAACANSPPADQAGAGEECEYVRVTGSNLPVKQCRTPAEREAVAAQNREAAEQGLRDLQRLDEFGVESPGAASLP